MQVAAGFAGGMRLEAMLAEGMKVVLADIVEDDLSQTAKDFGREPMTLTRSQAADLRAYDWPGNVRELKNLVQRVLILGTGLFLMVGLRAMPLRRLGYGFRMLWTGRKSEQEGDITPFNALMTSLSATIGTGNIAGVGTAIALGGPGAVFWMWATAFLGMATKYTEVTLAQKYRHVDSEAERDPHKWEGSVSGGPMYYIEKGLGTFGTGDDRACQTLLETFDFSPDAIIERLRLTEPRFAKTTNYGHFGHAEDPWEQPLAVEEVQG